MTNSNAAVSSVRVSDLRVEGGESPRLVDASSPRFSWAIKSDRRGAKQCAFRLELSEVVFGPKKTPTVFESDWVETDQCQWVEFSELRLAPKTRYQWRVQVLDEKNTVSALSDFAFFETNLAEESWGADWISDGREVAVGTNPPARYFRKAFNLKETPTKATLYLSAFGLVDPWLNGSKVTEDLFLPGWPDYRKRNYYVSLEVTDQLRSGENVLGLVLGDGWYSGTLVPTHQYDPTPKVSGWIELTDSKGERTVISTDDGWNWSEGPILANGIYFGESYDARKENALWCDSGEKEWDWNPVVVESVPAVAMDPRISPPVRRMEELEPVSFEKKSSGAYVYDFGQNMVGWVRLKLLAEAGEHVQIRFAEMLDADGNLFTKSLRTAKASVSYVAAGNGLIEWEPNFTYFGFRYVEITGIENPLTDVVTGVVVHTDLARIGHFECSNSLLNQLYSNALWGQKGNFVELPTDCPQRDERLGWTGDAQVFSHTALYNMRSGLFYRQWLAAVRDGFRDEENGGFSDIAPDVGFKHGAAGWADGGVIIPWMTWLHTGDVSLLEENFASSCDWVELMRKSAPDGIRKSLERWGDWLAPGYDPGKAPTPYQLIATAFYAYSTQLVSKMAGILGYDQKQVEYRALFEEIRAAFQKEYIDDDGRVTSNEQTAYLLALAFDLVPEALKPSAVSHLQEAIAVKDDHLSTGFLGTAFIMPVLSKMGLTDLAYKIILQETFPGWLFSVKNGATTIWERWNSWTPEEGFNKGGMNSFNHYAYGAVVGWFYDTITGIRLDESRPGWKGIEIAPQPGGGLSFAKASVDTPYGLVSSSWKIEDDRFEIEISVPPNSQAKVVLPVSDPANVYVDGLPLSELSGISNIEVVHNRVEFNQESGTYTYQEIHS